MARSSACVLRSSVRPLSLLVALLLVPPPPRAPPPRPTRPAHRRVRRPQAHTHARSIEVHTRAPPRTPAHAALAGLSNEQRIAHRVPPVDHPLRPRAYPLLASPRTSNAVSFILSIYAWCPAWLPLMSARVVYACCMGSCGCCAVPSRMHNVVIWTAWDGLRSVLGSSSDF